MSEWVPWGLEGPHSPAAALRWAPGVGGCRFPEAALGAPFLVLMLLEGHRKGREGGLSMAGALGTVLNPPWAWWTVSRCQMGMQGHGHPDTALHWLPGHLPAPRCVCGGSGSGNAWPEPLATAHPPHPCSPAPYPPPPLARPKEGLCAGVQGVGARGHPGQPRAPCGAERVAVPGRVCMGPHPHSQGPWGQGDSQCVQGPCAGQCGGS